MAEYIEKKDLVEFACRHVDGKLDANDIARFPTADVIGVVRCCDCIYRRENQDINNTCYLSCDKNWGLRGIVDPTDYCSYGERRCE